MSTGGYTKGMRGLGEVPHRVVKLLVVVVAATRYGVDAPVLHVIDEVALFIDATTKLASEITFEGFRVSDARQNAVALYALMRRLIRLRAFLSCVCQYR